MKHHRANFFAAIGFTAWCILFITFHPQPQDVQWARWLLLLPPLVLVPLGLRLWEHATANKRPPHRLIQRIPIFALPAALSLAAAQQLEQSWQAAALAAPWLIVTGLIAITGLRDAWQNRRAGIARLCIDAGLIYLAVGGTWAVIDRSGWRPLDFEPVIVMLTSIHFHFAGFVLPLVTGLTTGRLGCDLASKAACIGVVAGMPLVAIGIIGTKLGLPPAIETFAALWMSAAGFLAAYNLFRAAWQLPTAKLIRTLWTLAAAALAASMVLSAMYGLRHFLPLAWLDIPLMRITHGTANALGFALLATLGWSVEFRFQLPAPLIRTFSAANNCSANFSR